MRFAPAPEYHVFPTLERPLKPYEAVVRATRETLPLVASARPDVVVADILTLAPALAAELRGRAGGRRSSRTSTRAARRASRRTRSGARLPRTAAGRAAVAARSTAHRPRAGARARELNETRRAARPAGAGPGARRDQRAARARGDASRSSSTRGRGRRARHVVGPLHVGAAGRRRRAAAGRRRRSCWSRPRPSQDPRAPAAARGARRAWPDEPVRVLADVEPAPAAEPAATRAGQCAAGRLGLATRGRCRAATWSSATSGTGRCARAGVGLPGRRLPGGGRHERERCARRWAGVGVRVPRRFTTPRPLRLAVRRALRDKGMRARARELQKWSAGHDGAATGAELVEALAEAQGGGAAGGGDVARGVGGDGEGAHAHGAGAAQEAQVGGPQAEGESA